MGLREVLIEKDPYKIGLTEFGQMALETIPSVDLSCPFAYEPLIPTPEVYDKFKIPKNVKNRQVNFSQKLYATSHTLAISRLGMVIADVGIPRHPKYLVLPSAQVGDFKRLFAQPCEAEEKASAQPRSKKTYRHDINIRAIRIAKEEFRRKNLI